MKFNEKIEIIKTDDSLIIKEDRESVRNLKIIILAFSLFLFLVIYIDFEFFLNAPYMITEKFIIKCALLLFLNLSIILAPLNFIPYFKIKEFKMDKKSTLKVNKSYKSEMISSIEINTSDLKRSKVSIIKKESSSGYHDLLLELKNKEEIKLFSRLPLYELRKISREINIFINDTYKKEGI